MSKIEDRHVAKARKLVLQRFPEMTGAELSISERRSQSKGSVGGCSSGSSASGRRYVLTFKKDVSLPGGHSLKRLVRVTMRESGEVQKVTSSK